MNEKQIEEIVEKAVKAVIAELKLDEPKKEKACKPELGEEYFTLYSDGKSAAMSWDNESLDLKRWAIGNVFKTEEEAKRKVEKMKLEAEIERWIAENDPEALELDWASRYVFKYIATFDHDNRSFRPLEISSQQSLNEYYFSSTEKVFQFIAHFGDRLKLLLRGKVD